MADEDESQKTEEPTGKRLEDAVKKGNVVSSQELKNWMQLTGVTAIIAFGGPWFTGKIAATLASYLGRIHEIRYDEVGFWAPLAGLAIDFLFIMIFPFVIFIVLAIVANRMQTPAVFTLEKLKPDFSRLSPLKGLKKFFSKQILVNAVKNISKLSVLSIIVFLTMWPERNRLDTLMDHDILGLLQFMYEATIELLIALVIFLAILGALDFIYQKWKYLKDLRMTKQEVKDERKQSDGDPLIKRKLATIRMERARERMMANVPKADVVITNPTHYAVALEYKHGSMDVPRLLAKGVDAVAMKIREVAGEHNIPIIENPPLARALYATVDLDEEVPPEHYKAVAQVIGYVMKLKRAGLAGTKAQKPKERGQDEA